jgi:hypothetical protein
MGGPLMDLYGNPLGTVRTLFDKACRNAASPRDLTCSDWGVQELFQSSLFHHDGHLQVLEINSGGPSFMCTTRTRASWTPTSA